MTDSTPTHPETSGLDRREWLSYAAAFGSTFLAANGLRAADAGENSKPEPKPAEPPAGKRYEMKKSINLWAFPYPDRMTLRQCFELAHDAGFDAVEVNYNLEGDLSPEASSQDLKDIGKMAREIGIEISGVCSFLFWPYPLTSNDPARRAKGRDLARRMIDAAHHLGTPNLLVVPGAVYIPWAPEPEPVPNDVCWKRASDAINEAIPHARAAGVSLNLENIFANGFLLSPQEMSAFVDSFDGESVGIHFDTGNVMHPTFPFRDACRPVRIGTENPTLTEVVSWRSTQGRWPTATSDSPHRSSPKATASDGRRPDRASGVRGTALTSTRL